MQIWVDADACPAAVKQIIVTAAVKRAVTAIFVANKVILLPKSQYLCHVQVDKSSDAADTYIQEHAQGSDLVVTQDIPLAHTLVHAGVSAIDLRGHKFTPDNIGERLSMRNFMQEMRDSGEITGGPKQFADKDKRNFAATFDRELTRLLRHSFK